jgi:hypothetical protein
MLNNFHNCFRLSFKLSFSHTGGVYLKKKKKENLATNQLCDTFSHMIYLMSYVICLNNTCR